ncbi:Serendipity locus protein alpha [Frankliniella fusca]|uniref:Serendipity locus protein alpha n=1 Tax=Frankliniella fusca TaxID=407009 RepID=A0AAE1HRF3_9NEOP|nr:Serendipity locus protein alpha [Frankliniella fusca]
MQNSFQHYDYVLDKPRKRLELIEDISDDGGSDMPSAVDAFLSSVVEAYGMVGEMTSSDKQQVASCLAAVKERAVQSNHEAIGGSFDNLKWKCIVKGIMDTLSNTVETSRRTQMLRQVQLCDHNLAGIRKGEYIEILVIEFKRLLMNTARLLEYIHKYISWGTLRGPKAQNVLLLCASQLQKLFPLLLRALEVAHQISEQCVEAKDYIVQRMKTCFLKIKNIIEDKFVEDLEEFDDVGGGLFIMHMDQALSLLAVFDSSNDSSAFSSQWKSSVEPLLQHAMSIAQIASQFDFKMIHASGEKILRESENLEKECKDVNSNPAVRKLHALSLSNALEELEQRVCASVLKMYLQVFSDACLPLQTLCLQSLNSNTERVFREASDLSDAICNFDTHTDRILQVALFAIACSEDRNRVLGIRSCLASLESLETHLVPALSSVYLKQTPAQSTLASLLVEHWMAEVKLLQKLIDGIIDPAALAQVTHNVIWNPTAIIKKSIMAAKPIEKIDLVKLVKSVVSNAEVLSHQLQASAEELCLIQHSSAWNSLKELILAVREGKAVLQKIEGSNGSLSVDRVLKRCELLVTSVGKIQPLLEELENSQANSPSEVEGALKPRTEVSPANSPSSVSHRSLKKHLLRLGLPPDAEIDIDTTDSTHNLDLMQSVMDKTSAQPRFMTSFLYNEKKKSSFQNTTAMSRNTASFRMFSQKKAVTPHLTLFQQTLSIDVPKLASLSETLICRSNSSQVPSLSQLKFSTNDGELEDKNASDNISTPERMHDLVKVQKRIDAVKTSDHCLDQSLFSHLLL